MSNKALTDVAMQLASEIDSERLWEESLMQLRDHGLIEGKSMDDLELLVEDVTEDFKLAQAKHIKERLWHMVWPVLNKQLLRGVGDWFRAKIAEDKDELASVDLGEAGA